MKKIMVQIWALSLLLLHVTCTAASNTPTYTLTPPVSNVWDLDIYSNSNLSALALVGPQGQGNLGNLSLAPLMTAINQTAVVPTSGSVVPVVAHFSTTNGKCSVEFSQGSTVIATYTMPTTNPLEPFAWLQPWVGKTPLGINIYAIAQANGTINIRLHINSTVTTPTYSLGQVWNLDIYTNVAQYSLNAFEATSLNTKVVAKADQSFPYLSFFEAMNNSSPNAAPIVAQFTLPATGGSVVTFTQNSQVLAKYTLNNGLISYFLFNIKDASIKQANGQPLNVFESTDSSSSIATICRAQGTINIRFHLLPVRPTISWAASYSPVISMNKLPLNSIELSSDSTNWILMPSDYMTFWNWPSSGYFSLDCVYAGLYGDYHSYCAPDGFSINTYLVPIIPDNGFSYPLYIRINKTFVFNTGFTMGLNGNGGDITIYP